MQQEQQYFIPLNGDNNNLNLVSMISVRPRQASTPMFTTKRSGVGIDSNYGQPKQAQPTMVTPTSTPPIRFHQSSMRREDDIISPSPLATEAQRRYYEDSTWRMYDRIQASRPSQQPTRPSSMASLPRYPPKHLHERLNGGQDGADHTSPYGGDDEDELIFDLEL